MYENEVPATCTGEGSREAVVYCETCGAEISRTPETIPVLGHDWGEWETITEPSCTGTGLHQHTCRRCGVTESESLPATGHTPTTKPGSPATCTESGWTDHIYCSVCEEPLEPYQTEIPSLGGHDWGAWVTVTERNCGVDGLERRTCQRAGCGATEERILEATGAHVAGDTTTENVKEATCTTPYSWDEVTYCSVCGGVMSTQPRETGSPLGHYYDWDGGVEYVKDPTCTEDGEVKYTCQRCGATVTETIPAGHTPGDPTDKPPTCVESGYNSRIVCTKCGAVLEAGTEVPSTGTEHDFYYYGYELRTIDGESVYCDVYKCKYCEEEELHPAAPSGYPGGE